MRSDDVLARYLHEIGRHPLLTRGDELRIARLSASGDESARRRLVECNLRLVVAIARRYRGLGLDLLDLIQEGNVGLMAAAERYDWRRDARFATYASWWIRREICRALSTRSRLIRLPVRIADSATRVKRAERALAQRLGRQAACEEVAREAGVDENTVALVRRAELATISLSEPIAGEGACLEDRLSDEGEGDPARLVADAPGAVGAIVGLPGLSGQTRRVLELRYGLDGGRSHSLAEVAEELDLSRERVRQLAQRALFDLARRPELRGLRHAA
jgi:RNA polymerase primary sigma factor